MKDTSSPSTVLLKTLIFALLGWLVIQPDPLFAKIYKYKDENGKTHFTDDASKIPMRYRKKDSVKNFKGVYEPNPLPGASGASTEGEKVKDKAKDKDDGLSEKDEGLVKKTIQAFNAGVAMGKKYKTLYPRVFSGQGAVSEIQANLPSKESLARELAGSKAPELQAALGFLKRSIAVDQQTKSIGTGRKARISEIFNRIASDGDQQAALIKRLEKALKDSKKKKEEAAKKKKEEESKKDKKK